MNTQQRNRLIVTGSLIVLLIAASVIFGPHVLLVALAALVTSFVIELLNSQLRKQKFDPTTFSITPLIITLMTTPSIASDFWMVIVATAFGVFFAKTIFGGEGKNIFNPAALGLVFIALAFPVQVNRFLDPITKIVDPATFATIFKNTPAAIVSSTSLVDLLMGQYAGAMGTTFKLGILILGLVLMILKISDWKIPATFLGTYYLFSLLKFLLSGMGGDSFLYALYSVLMGHLLFVAMFMATDPQTQPLYTKGRIIYGVLLGFVSWIIQNTWLFNPSAPNTEGTIYAILFMNAMTGLIDVWTTPKVKDIPLLEEVEA